MKRSMFVNSPRVPGPKSFSWTTPWANDKGLHSGLAVLGWSSDQAKAPNHHPFQVGPVRLAKRLPARSKRATPPGVSWVFLQDLKGQGPAATLGKIDYVVTICVLPTQPILFPKGCLHMSWAYCSLRSLRVAAVHSICAHTIRWPGCHFLQYSIAKKGSTLPASSSNPWGRSRCAAGERLLDRCSRS